MLKNISNLKGAQELTTSEQKNIKGGKAFLIDSGSGEGGKSYKCCWTGTNNCSSCVVDGASCVSGATLTAC